MIDVNMSSATPRFETRADPKAPSWASEIRGKADELGTPLMPWQDKAAALIGELSSEDCTCHDPPRKLPRFKTVVVTVCRQMGKTTVSRSTVAAVADSDPFLEMFGTAQTRQYAAKHVIGLGRALERGGADVYVTEGVGNERVRWPNGTTYMPISPTESGGHGDSIAFMLIDEGWKVTLSTMAGVRPAMIARPHSQLLAISTMGTLESHVWNGLVEQGRESLSDDNARTAYLEYSAPTDEAVFEDTCVGEGEDGCVWGQWMPALGVTVSHADVRDAIKDMMADPAQGRAEVIRAFGNRTTASLVSLFPAEWLESAWRVLEPPDRFVLAVDVNESPAGASVASGHIADDDGTLKPAVRVFESRPGSPRWVPDFVRRVVRERSVEAIAVDLGGPSRVIREELKAIETEERVPIVDRVPRDHAADTQRLYDDLREGRVLLEKTPDLAEAMDRAVRKDLSDSGLWVVNRRRMTADASPLIAAVLAHGVAIDLDVQPRVPFFVG